MIEISLVQISLSGTNSPFHAVQCCFKGMPIMFRCYQPEERKLFNQTELWVGPRRGNILNGNTVTSRRKQNTIDVFSSFFRGTRKQKVVCVTVKNKWSIPIQKKEKESGIWTKLTSKLLVSQPWRHSLQLDACSQHEYVQDTFWDVFSRHPAVIQVRYWCAICMGE